MPEKKNRKGILHRAASVMLAVMVAMTFTLMDTQPASAASKPGKVGGVHVKTVSQTQIQISWKAVKKAKGYEVYRGKKLVKRTTAKKFTEKKLKPGTTYKYKVRAYKTKKQKQWYNKKTKKWVTKKPKKKYRGKKRTKTVRIYGKFSRVVTAKTKAKPQPKPFTGDTAQKPASGSSDASKPTQGVAEPAKPTKPTTPTAPAAKPLVVTGFKVDISYNSAKLSWNKAEGATGYKVSVNDGAVGTTSSCSYTVTGLKSSKQYTFSVQAKNASAVGSAVSTKLCTKQVPAPTNVKTVSGYDTVTITWDAMPYVTGYYVKCSGNKVLVKEAKYTATGLAPNQIYSFYINPYIEGDTCIYGTTVKAKTGLQAPGSIKAGTVKERTAVLSWNAVQGATAYAILNADMREIGKTSTCSYMLKGLEPGTEYSFYIVPEKNGERGAVDTANKYTFRTAEERQGFFTDKNISMKYHGVSFYLGQSWSTDLYTKLKNASNGSVKLIRPGYAHEWITGSEGYIVKEGTYDVTKYMFDINDYSDFLAVEVADGKIISWDTNGPYFGSYYGTDVVWGDNVEEYSWGGNVGYRTKGGACSDVFTDIDRGDTVVGGFGSAIYVSNDFDNTMSRKNESMIGYHYINAYRVAGGISKLAYSDALDGGTRTYQGKRYGVQAFVETIAANKKCSHDTELMKSGPCAGQTQDERDEITWYATGAVVGGENCATGGCGEACIGAYMDSNIHMVAILEPQHWKAVAVGVCKNYNAVQFEMAR